MSDIDLDSLCDYCSVEHDDPMDCEACGLVCCPDCYHDHGCEVLDDD